MTVPLLVLGAPCVIWIASYVYLAAYHKQWNLLRVRIHESGRYTFLQTVFYFNHLLRELLIDTLFVLCIFWSYTVMNAGILHANLEQHSALFLLCLAVFTAVVFLGAAKKVGLKNALLDFLQFRETDSTVRFGSHWQMHFLSTLVVMLVSIFPATLFDVRSVRLVAVVFLAFFALSALFRVRMSAVTDRRWLLHAGREIATFFFIAAVPGLAPTMDDWLPKLDQPKLPALGLLSVIAAAVGYCSWAFLRTDVRAASRGPRDIGIPYLLASHVFEHVLDFFYMVLLMLVLISCVG